MSQPKSTPEKFISRIQNNYNHAQPWLNVMPQFSNKSNAEVWNKSMLRRAKTGGLRAPGIEAISSDCPRKLMFQLYGISTYKKTPEIRAIMKDIQDNNIGVAVNNEVDRIMSLFNDIKSGNSKTKEYIDWRTGAVKYTQEGQSFALSPKPFKMIDGTIKKGFTGFFDYATSTEIIELKAVNPSDLHKPISKKIKGQITAYLKGNKHIQGAWVIFIPLDLSELNWKDSGTWRAFYMSREDAAIEWKETVTPRLLSTIEALNTVNGDAAKFYALIDELPECSETLCCGIARVFRENYQINADWTFSAK